MPDLARRLGKLEVIVAGRYPESGPPFAVVVGGWPAWERLFATMAPGHVRTVRDHFERLAAWDRREFLDYPRENGAVRAAIDVMAFHLKRGTPLALPPAVAETCLTIAHTSLRCMPDACEACGCLLPVRQPLSGPPVSCFERCPLCGGPVGRMPRPTGESSERRPPWRA